MENLSAIIAMTVAWLFMGVGFLGVFLPVVPGCGLIALGVLIYKLILPGSILSWAFIGGAILAAGIALIVDYLAFIWGAKRWGASGWGLAGAIIGIVLGVIFLTPFLGLIVGPLIGAFVGECISGRTLREAFKAGMGTVVGGLMAFLIRFGVAVGIITGFLYQMSQMPTCM